MTINHLLQDFTLGRENLKHDMSQVSLEEEKLAAFEQGYQAGWDDSLKTSESSDKDALEKIVKSISEIGDARDEINHQIFSNMKSFVDELINSIIPEILHETLGFQIKSLITESLEKRQSNEITVYLSSEENSAAELVSESLSELPVRIEKADSLSGSQVRVTFSDGCEQEMDNEALVRNIRTSVKDFFENEVRCTKRIE